LVFF